jgi:hypothetical protein
VFGAASRRIMHSFACNSIWLYHAARCVHSEFLEADQQPRPVERLPQNSKQWIRSYRAGIPTFIVAQRREIMGSVGRRARQ